MSATVPAATHARAALPWSQARALAHRLPAPLPVEQMPLAEAAGRTLGAPLRAATKLPGFDNAAMDGYAICGPGPWRLVGRVLAGCPAPAALAPGEAVEVATGAVVPRQADRVVEYEVSQRADDLVLASPGPRRHIRRASEYARSGQELLPPGAVLTAAALGLAASVGIDGVTVRARPTVRVLITGDEVISGGVPPPGKVRDAIGPMLAPLLRAWDADIVELRWLPDEPPRALTDAVADSLADTVVTVACGSSCGGLADRLHQALDGLGATVHVNGVDCRPGHPQVLAERGDRWLVGVPGNPFAAFVAAFTLIQPLLTGLAGRPLPALPGAPLRGRARPVARGTRIVPARWDGHDLRVVDGAQPGYLGAAAQADALAVVGPTWRSGQPVDLLPLPG